MQDVAFFGDAPSGMKGLVNSDQVDKIVPNKWFDGASTTTDEMLEILNEAPTRIVNGSNQKETPNTMLVPYDVYRIISTTARSTTSDTTVMEFFLRTNPFIRSIEPINELAASKSVLAKDRIICYDRSPEKLQLHIPQTLEFLPRSVPAWSSPWHPTPASAAPPCTTPRAFSTSRRPDQTYFFRS